MADKLIFYYAPQTRATAVRTLLEELQAPHKLHVLNFKAGEQREPAYLAINPLGKVPAIQHRGAMVTELAAVFIYLADEFPAAGLAPPIGSPLRGPYLRWMAYYGNCMEPAVADRYMKHDPGPYGQSAYGDYDSMLGVLAAQLRKGPYMLGETFSAADVLWGTALNWLTMFGLVPKLPEIASYLDRVTSRPAFVKSAAADAALAAEHEEAAKAIKP